MKEIDNDLKIYYAVKGFTNYLTEQELFQFESTIFCDVTDKQKIVLEYDRLKSELKKYPDKYAAAISSLLEIERMIKVMDFDPTVLRKVSKEIVKQDLLYDIPVRLYNSLPDLEVECKLTLREKRKERLMGQKRSNR